MTIPTLSPDLPHRIRELFPQSEARQKMALELMYYDHWPTTKELKTIAGGASKSVRSLYTVLEKLREAELFTKAQGSIPLYRVKLKGVSDSFAPSGEDRSLQRPPVEVGTPHTGVAVDPRSPTFEPLGETAPSAVEGRVDRMEVQIDDIRKTFEGGMQQIQAQLNAMTSAMPPVVDPRANVRETVNPSLSHAAPNPEVAIADVIDPSMDLETANPLEQVQDDVMEMEGSIISRKTVGFTPKSLMLFDLARQKGFPGNFADFVNSCITSSFRSRSFRLVVQDEVP